MVNTDMIWDMIWEYDKYVIHFQTEAASMLFQLQKPLNHDSSENLRFTTVIEGIIWRRRGWRQGALQHVCFSRDKVSEIITTQ